MLFHTYSYCVWWLKVCLLLFRSKRSRVLWLFTSIKTGSPAPLQGHWGSSLKCLVSGSYIISHCKMSIDGYSGIIWKKLINLVINFCGKWKGRNWKLQETFGQMLLSSSTFGASIPSTLRTEGTRGWVKIQTMKFGFPRLDLCDLQVTQRKYGKELTTIFKNKFNLDFEVIFNLRPTCLYEQLPIV